MSIDGRKDEAVAEFIRLLDIMRSLRAENGCEWDRAQTHESLRQYLVEETYEVLEAIDGADWEKLSEELGDLMLHIVFHAKLGEERGDFDVVDVLHGINEKLIGRHPHVFDGKNVENVQEIRAHWEEIKYREGRSSRLEGVPERLPALQRATRIQGKAADVGFDWKDRSPVWAKIIEEMEELRSATENGDGDHVREELGDVLFSIVNLSRHLGVNPEDSLRATIRKFEKRFKAIEAEAESSGRDISDMSLDEMDAIWEKQKDAREE